MPPGGDVCSLARRISCFGRAGCLYETASFRFFAFDRSSVWKEVPWDFMGSNVFLWVRSQFFHGSASMKCANPVIEQTKIQHVDEKSICMTIWGRAAVMLQQPMIAQLRLQLLPERHRTLRRAPQDHSA